MRLLAEELISQRRGDAEVGEIHHEGREEHEGKTLDTVLPDAQKELPTRPDSGTEEESGGA